MTSKRGIGAVLNDIGPPDPLKVLARYLTGRNVTHHSVGLGVGGNKGADAQLFFELRSAFGVSGYPSATDAEDMIRRTLGKPAAAASEDESVRICAHPEGCTNVASPGNRYCDGCRNAINREQGP